MRTEQKKCVLVLIRCYLPGSKFGGPISSVVNIIHHLSDQFSFKVLTSDRDLRDDKPYDDIRQNQWHQRNGTEMYYIRRNMFTVLKLIWVVRKAKKDVLYLNSLFDPIFTIGLLVAKKIGLIDCPIVLAPRGELFDEALDFSPRKKKFFLSFADSLRLFHKVIWHATSKEENVQIQEKLNVSGSLIHIALPLVNTEDVPDTKDPPAISHKFGADPFLSIVFLSRISKDKNLPFAFDVLSKIKVNVKFDVYGPIEDSMIWEACLKKISQLPPHVEVEYLGRVDRPQVKHTLRKYNLFFLPTFAENFGHAIAESLSVGTPVLISANTPWRNLTSDGLGWDIPLSSEMDFVRVIHDLYEQTKSGKQESRHHIKKMLKLRIAASNAVTETKTLFSAPFSR